MLGRRKNPNRWSSSHPGPTRDMVEVVRADMYDEAIVELEETQKNLLWLVMHAIDSASISKAKGAELLGVSLIDMDTVLSNEVKS